MKFEIKSLQSIIFFQIFPRIKLKPDLELNVLPKKETGRIRVATSESLNYKRKKTIEKRVTISPHFEVVYAMKLFSSASIMMHIKN